MGLASEIETAVDQLLNGFVTAKSAALCGILTPLALTGITIYIIIIGYAVMRGEAQDGLHTSLWKLVKMAFVSAAALGVGIYQGEILNAFYGLQEGLISAFSTQTTVGGVIDQFMVPYDALAAAIGQEAGTSLVPNLTLYFAMFIVIVAEVWIFAIGIGLYLLAKVALALVLALGPAFILCAMFPATQRFCESWIGQVVNYVILSVLVVAGFTMLTLFAQEFAAKALADYGNDSAIIKDCVALLIVSVALGIVMLHLNAIASALGGGASVSGGGVAAAAMGGIIAGLALGRRSGGSKNDQTSSTNSISKGSGNGTESSSRQSPQAPSAALPIYQRHIDDNLKQST
ncbi:type IV secretion system protein [Asticcacaulis sp. EMRT-3]|uniref:type IV secretion system protein n=1 Tax=Asticcacaulis sp. EMRT-3 TaxID=3040349 RepID=UPI0024AFA6DD|nr:type IV secretion system protein [Asticcacaulis sp. EMRT-3]MDI7776574.1 type IV secretion system protein [Asticcacaulis sp. EMRT-3]